MEWMDEESKVTELNCLLGMTMLKRIEFIPPQEKTLRTRYVFELVKRMSENKGRNQQNKFGTTRRVISENGRSGS